MPCYKVDTGGDDSHHALSYVLLASVWCSMSSYSAGSVHSLLLQQRADNVTNKEEWSTRYKYSNIKVGIINKTPPPSNANDCECHSKMAVAS